VIKINIHCISEGSSTKYDGTAENRQHQCNFYLYFKHDRWELDITEIIEGEEYETSHDGIFGHGDDDDMSPFLAKSIIVFHIARQFGDAEVEVWAKVGDGVGDVAYEIEKRGEDANVVVAAANACHIYIEGAKPDITPQGLRPVLWALSHIAGGEPETWKLIDKKFLELLSR
jgi:hypothetical protein